MFTTFAEQLERHAGGHNLSEAFFAAFPVIDLDVAEGDRTGSPALDENGIISLLNSTLNANKMLAQTFGMSSSHSVSVTPAGRNAHSAIARLREARMTPPDTLLSMLSSHTSASSGRTPANNALKPNEPVLH